MESLIRCLQTLLLLLLTPLAQSAWAAACVSPDASCTEWVSVQGRPARALIYRNHSLETRNERINRALVVIHGQGRNAHDYYRHIVAAASRADALENTLLVSPRFASNEGRKCHDQLAPDELNWVCSGPASWRSGGAAASGGEITSFSVIDTVLGRLARRDLFPNLKTIVLAGHSAGGQYVTRYEMANRLHEKLGIPIAYVVANPSSYTYLDGLRPIDGLRPTTTALPPGIALGAPGEAPAASTQPPGPFAAFANAKDCTRYDDWPYGLQRRTGYAAKLAPEDLKRQLAARPTSYLLGELDVRPSHNFDKSCAAMAQGPTRLARGLAYGKYVNERFGAKHKVSVVPACGHSARCMFSSETALALLFPKD